MEDNLAVIGLIMVIGTVALFTMIKYLKKIIVLMEIQDEKLREIITLLVRGKN